MTQTLKLDRLARGAEAARFARAIRDCADASVGADGFTASGGSKQTAPKAPGLGTERFTASGDAKQVAGSRPKIGGVDFTASGDGKRPPPATSITASDFTATGDGKRTQIGGVMIAARPGEKL